MNSTPRKRIAKLERIEVLKLFSAFTANVFGRADAIDSLMNARCFATAEFGLFNDKLACRRAIWLAIGYFLSNGRMKL